MRSKVLALVAGAAFAAVMLTPEPADAQRGFRGGGVGFRGGAIGMRGIGVGRVGIGRVGIGRVGIGRVGWAGRPVWGGARWAGGWRPGWGRWGWRPGWGLGAAAVIGAGIAASSYYPYYGYGYPYDYGYGYGYPAVYGGGYYGGCPLVQRVVWTGWGYRTVLVQACY